MSEHRCDTGHFDRSICPEPCGMMHSFCSTCGERQDACAHEPDSTPTEREGVAEVGPLAVAGLSEAEFKAWLDSECRRAAEVALREAADLCDLPWRTTRGIGEQLRERADRIAALAPESDES